MLDRLGLRLRFALFFAALAGGGATFLGVGLWLGWSRAGGAPDGFVIAGLVGGFGLTGLTAWIALLFDENVARPILALAAELHTRAQSNVTADIDAAPARYLGALAPAAQAIHAELEAARASQARAFAERTARMARDKALLETLLRDLTQAVLVLSEDRHILLYNEAAVALLGPIGLNRPVGSFLQLAPVEQALARHNAAPDGRAEPFLTVGGSGDRLLTGAVSAVRSDAVLVGHVVMFHDVTEALRTHADLEALLRETLEEARRPAMAMGALLDVLDLGSGPGADSARFAAALREEVDRLSAHLGTIAARQAGMAAAQWPIRDVGAAEIATALAPRHPGLVNRTGEARLRCDGFAMTALLDRILDTLERDPARRDLALSAEPRGAEICLVLGWSGPAIPQGQLEEALRAPLSEAYGPYTGRDALDVHRSDLWAEPGPRIVLPLPAAGADPDEAQPHRPDFYDFDLPAQSRPGLDRPLTELAYVVFDTETTGLDPQRDEVVQIAGVRLLGARLLRGETFDQLVAPGRPIPAAATAIHGITDAMVDGAPGFAAVAEAFRGFAEDTVLVAHNAPFDMAFLHRVGGFAHPALCTARLSNALHAHTGAHTLDDLAARFGVEIDAALRHTALGDALATAELFRRMLPLLAARGVTTLGAALDLQGPLD